MHLELIALAVLFVVALAWIYRRDRTRIRTARAALFDGCLDLFDDCRLRQDAVDMPVLDGVYRGRAFRVVPIIDHINLRKLPSLWLLVTLREAVPYDGVLDFLARPQNTEFYSPSADLRVTLQPPAGWPEHAALRTDRPDSAPPVTLVGRHIEFFDDPYAKELLIAPGGVRLVYQANQARRSHYLVLRQAEFEDLSLNPERLRGLMDRAIALHDDLLRSVHAGGQASVDAAA